MQLFDRHTIDQLIWPESEQAQAVRSFVAPLIKGVNPYISNVITNLYLLVVDDYVIPLTVNNKEYSNSYVVSNYYAIHALEEKLEERHALLRALQRPFLRLGGEFLKWFRINKVVLVNNWLLTNSFLPKLSDDQINRIVKYLSVRFPGHFLMIRNVHKIIDDQLVNALKAEKFRLIPSRQIFVYDPALKPQIDHQARRHLRRDKRLIDELGYTLIEKRDITSEDIPRILELYKSVYIQGFTSFGPAYTEKFIRHALLSDYFDFYGVRKEGRIDGIIGQCTSGKIMAAPFFGYDKSLPHAKELYRMVTSITLQQADKRNLILNNGSGGEKFKTYRGMTLHPEFVAIYDKHLSPFRRLFWKLVETVVT